MKLLAGMVREPRISAAAVDAERGVVLSELRENDGPQKRIADATTAHLFAGQLLGERSPIGTPESLAAARAGAVPAFHDRWYRPDRAVGVMVRSDERRVGKEGVRTCRSRVYPRISKKKKTQP